MITPIFRIFDIKKAKEFYINFLGFQLDWIHRYEENMPSYYQISLYDVILHLSEHHDDSSPGSSIRIKFNNIKKYHATLQKKNYQYSNPSLERTPWDTIELTVIDPFRNKITFYEEIA